MVDLGRERPEVLFVGNICPGQAHPQQGASVEAMGKGDDGRAVGRGTGDLDRVFHRLGPRGQEDGLLRRGSRRQAVEPLRETDIGLVHHDLEAGVGKALQLGLDRLDDVRMVVADI